MTKKTGKPMGRPRIEIDFDEFEKLCLIQATLEEMAGWFGCSADTVERRVSEHYEYEDEQGNKINPTFAEVFGRLRGKGKIGLRRTQFQRALAGSDKMLIHLGKQHLGQSDKHEIDVTERVPLVIVRGKAEDGEDDE